MPSDDVLDVVGLCAASSHMDFGDTSSASELLGASCQAPIHQDFVAYLKCTPKRQRVGELFLVEHAYIKAEGSVDDSIKNINLLGKSWALKYLKV